MKNVIFSVSILMIVAFSCAGQTVAPQAVSKAFAAKFPNAKDVKWGKENAHEYEAEFTEGTLKASANFNDKGEWLETEMVIDVSAVPQTVKDAFEKLYPGVTIIAADKIEKSTGTIHYEIEYKSGTKTHEAIFDENGKQV